MIMSRICKTRYLSASIKKSSPSHEKPLVNNNQTRKSLICLSSPDIEKEIIGCRKVETESSATSSATLRSKSLISYHFHDNHSVKQQSTNNKLENNHHNNHSYQQPPTKGKKHYLWVRVRKLLKKLLPKKNIVVTICGLRGSGKTSIVYKMKLGEIVSTIPTIRYNVECVTFDNVRFVVWDFDDSEFWIRFRHSLKDSRAVLFVVDSSERQLFPEAKKLLKLIVSHRELASDAVFVILAHKQDLPDAISPEGLQKELDLYSVLEDRHWILIPSSIKNGTIHGKNYENSLKQALCWLQSELKFNSVMSNNSSSPQLT